MATDANSAFEFSHRTNIDRYQRLLRTYLTETERQFIQRRIAEEEAHLATVQEAARSAG